MVVSSDQSHNGNIFLILKCSVLFKEKSTKKNNMLMENFVELCLIF